jgi:hypothetical protein
MLERSGPFWIMVAGVCAIIIVVLTFVLVRQGSHPTTSLPGTVVTTPGQTTPAQTTPPPPTYYFSYDGATQYPCSYESNMHSVGGGYEEPFSFVNRSATYVQIDWLNLNGARELYDTLQPGESYTIESYVGHVWLIANPEAACLGIFDVDNYGQVVITS